MSSEVASSIPERARSGPTYARRPQRMLAVQLLGPITVLGGIVWAIAQPYRIVFLHTHGKGVYDYLVQPPLLVVLVGVLFTLLITPGLVHDLEEAERGSEG